MIHLIKEENLLVVGKWVPTVGRCADFVQSSGLGCEGIYYGNDGRDGFEGGANPDELLVQLPNRGVREAGVSYQLIFAIPLKETSLLKKTKLS